MNRIQHITTALLRGALALTPTLLIVGDVHAQSCLPAPSQLVTWLPADGGAASDIAGGDNHGVYRDGPAFSFFSNGAFLFDGTNSVTLAKPPAVSESWTYEFWIRVDFFTDGNGLGGDGSYFLDRTSATRPLASLKAVDGQFAFQVRYNDDSGLRSILGSPIVPGKWTHIAMVRNFGTSFRLHVDGVRVATSPDNGEPHSLPTPKLGRHHFLAGFLGAIDEFSIYDRALSDVEIDDIFNADSAGKCKPDPRPISIDSWGFRLEASDPSSVGNEFIESDATSPSLPFMDTFALTAGGSQATTAHDFSNDALSFVFDHDRTGAQGSAARTLDTIHFRPIVDTPYSFSGSYRMTGIGQIVLTAILVDETTGGTVFLSSQVSRNELDKRFTLGLKEGDLQNILIGPAAGSLTAGHDYRLTVDVGVRAIVGDTGAAGEGSVTLDFRPISIDGWGFRLEASDPSSVGNEFIESDISSPPLPFTDTFALTAGGSQATTAHDFTGDVLSFIFDHDRTGTQGSAARTLDTIHFSPIVDTPYSFSGSYRMTGIGQIVLTAILVDETTGGTVFLSSQVSRNELDKRFTLGLKEGDLQNILIGPAAGSLMAGHNFRLTVDVGVRAIVGDTGAAGDGFVTLDLFGPVPTPEGAGVTVVPVDPTTGNSVSLTFDTVTGGGTTSVTAGGTGPSPPSGFKVGSSATYFEIETTATFSGQIEICFAYSGVGFQNESDLEVFHYEDTDGDGVADTWETLETASLDTANDVICAFTTSLSLFTIFEPGETIPPTADPGQDQSIHASQTVILDGTSSFDDTTASANLQFAWSISSKPTGSSATLSGADTATPSFVADVPGEYRVQLIVTDEAGNASAPSEVIVSSLNVEPTAEAGDSLVIVLNTPAFLDGTGSMDPDGDPLGFAWTIPSAPTGSIAVLVGATTATPSLTPDLVGTYVIQLVVNDVFADSTPDTVTITAITGAAFAEINLQAACEFVTGLPNSSFDARGHRNYFCNTSSQVIHFLQVSDLAQASSHLEKMISRTDGCPLRTTPDPKGQGQASAADFITDCDAQQQLYRLLTDALSVL